MVGSFGGYLYDHLILKLFIFNFSFRQFLLLVTYGSTQNPSDTAAGNGAAGQLEQIITLPPADGSAKASVAAEAGSAGGDAVGECAASLQTFIECAKAEVGEREQAEAKEAAGALHSKIAPCFTK